jgi:protein transport protein SEC24
MNFINNYLYPKMFPIHHLREMAVQDMYRLGQIIEDQKVVMPMTIPTSSEKLSSDGIYLIDTNAFIFVYVMRDVDRELL